MNMKNHNLWRSTVRLCITFSSTDIVAYAPSNTSNALPNNLQRNMSVNENIQEEYTVLLQ